MEKKSDHFFSFLNALPCWGVFIFTLIIWSCTTPAEEEMIQGHTMGTTYTVKWVKPGDRGVNKQVIQTGIDSILAELNRQMSTYLEDSEISNFNRFRSNRPFPVSPEFFRVVQQAAVWSQVTDGAFDITVFPLLSLWGFGPQSEEDGDVWNPPDIKTVKKSLDHVGYQLIGVLKNSFRKRNPSTALDLGALAKGFAVDEVCEFLKRNAIGRFMVEIGGEVRCRGTNIKNKIWEIGIDQPSLNGSSQRKMQLVIPLKNSSLATSGDYRNYIEFEGQKFSHEIDPRTGFPARNSIASVTVLSKSCMDADALATGLMIMGYNRGRVLVESLDGFEALWILHLGNGFQIIQSDGMLQVSGRDYTSAPEV